jgi:hypothetical protein
MKIGTIDRIGLLTPALSSLGGGEGEEDFRPEKPYQIMSAFM